MPCLIADYRHSKTMIKIFVPILFLIAINCVSSAEMIPNGGFEEGLSGWETLWTREPDVGRASIDNNIFKSGKCCARIEHIGKKDWSFNSSVKISVESGDLFELEAWVKIEGRGEASPGIVAYGENNKVLNWSLGKTSTRGSCDWYRLHSKFIIPDNVVEIQPRLTGTEEATVWFDDFSIKNKGNVKEMNKMSGKEITLKNKLVSLTLHASDATISVKDLRSGGMWEQRQSGQELILKNAQAEGNQIKIVLLHIPSDLEVETVIALEKDSAEFTVSMEAREGMPVSLRFPHPFVTQPGTYLVVPMNEGISYPVEDETISPMRLVAYGGHGLCMAFFGATDNKQGYVAILETPDDASIRIDRLEGKLCIIPEWDSQKGKFGYTRKIRYIFLDRGGHTAICKRYRAYVKSIGKFKTLEQKRKENPNVDLLIGAVNVWCWEKDSLSIVNEMKSLGIDRILWSNKQSPEAIDAMNEIDGVLTSRYDIYQDVMNPENFKFLRGAHSDWPTEAWPKDIMTDARGNWIEGWKVKGKDGKMYPCGVLCDKLAPDYAKKRIPEELKTHKYRCRFIDTTTASSWRECYNPDHPLTRTESRQWKMELLRLISQDMNLVVGSETGHDASVPYLHYFEGMLSLAPYRVHEAGRNMPEILDEVPQVLEKFQVGYKYRLPLWELVYHECVVAQWYWGDYNNKIPKIWDKRDLFNALYGTPPMFMFNKKFWEANKERFVQSYKNTCPYARMVGYSEMADHRFLTADRSVQQTVFANGITITVNFGENPYRLPDRKEVPPMGFCVAGMKK